MKRQRQEVDVVDVHLTSVKARVDAFTQYPLLDGAKKYTLEITEFVSPLAGQDPMPSETTNVDNLLFEIKRKHVHDPAVAVGAVTLVTPPNLTAQMLAANVFLPYGLFTPDLVQFRKNEQRPMGTPGDLAYHLQRFFNDVIGRYRQAHAVAEANRLVQHTIANDPASTQAQITAANLLLNGINNNGLIFIANNTGSTIKGALHGGGADQDVTAETRFVTVMLQPNGCLKLFFSPIFTKHFFLSVTTYGKRILGIGKDNVVAFRTLDDGTVAQGYEALTNNNGDITIVAGETAETRVPCRPPIGTLF